MKKCTYCGKEYSDDASECTIDMQPLEIVIPQAPDPKPQQRLIPSETTHCFIVRGDDRRGPYLPGQIRMMWKNGSITADSAILWGTLTAPVPVEVVLNEPQFVRSEAPAGNSRDQSTNVWVWAFIIFVVGFIGLISCWHFIKRGVSSEMERLSGRASTEQEASATQQSSITLLNVYVIGDSYVVTELENTGKTGITAFKGRLTEMDDFSAPVAEQEVRFTSDTRYFPLGSPSVKDLNKYASGFPPRLPPHGDQSPHVIAPGEKFVIIKIKSDKYPDFASTKENLANCIYGYEEIMRNAPLETCRFTKKIIFQLEKCITQ